MGSEVQIEYMLQDTEDLASLRASLPSDQYMLFLRNKGLGAISRGVREAPGVPIEESLQFYRPVSSQGVFRNKDGRVAVPLSRFDDGFPVGLSDRRFSEIVSAVKAFGIDDGSGG